MLQIQRLPCRCLLWQLELDDTKNYYVVHSNALTKHKQLRAHEGPNISCLRRTRVYQRCIEIELDLSGDLHVCYKNENDNLKLISSSTPSCAVPIKLCRSHFPHLFIFQWLMNAIRLMSLFIFVQDECSQFFL